ncbi:hypothetical protein BJ322DRAFT_60192 [Thelephora terrestris]|uniref:Uncharacterized protein n=1 Tax=Thelephora terrestris TaxID=56493 RepID=A0A9P6LCB1_9AGAM|nr:hypothetical protein BJ322DRAFT_60192 [Thelephora terrestris]
MSPQTVDSGNAPSPGVNRRSSVPKPSGPRPQSHRTSTCDPRPSLLISPMQAVPEPSSLNCQAPTEPDLQPVNEEGGTMTYSFLDMNATSRPPSLMDGPGKPPNPTQPLPHTNHDSLRLLPIIRTSPTPSNRDSDRRPEIRNSKRVSLSAVIRQLPIPKLRLSAELHPHSPGRPQTSRSSRSLRPQTGGASPTESVPMTTSEVSEIRFCSPGEGSESNASQRSARDTPSPSLKVTTMTSPIYQKLFGTQQGEVPPDGVLGKKRPLRRKQLSASAFDIPPRT